MTSLVIPVAEEPHNPTLPLALASARRQAPWLAPVLVGTPFLLGPHLQPGESTLEYLHQDPHDSLRNTTAMLAAAVESELVTDPFVWSNDDIYFRTPVDLATIDEAGATARGPLSSGIFRGQFRRTADLTAKLLADLRPYTPWDYERHVPLLVHKQDMREALQLGPAAYPRSMYQNLRRELPFTVREDVKILFPELLEEPPPGPFFSTGNRFPIDLLERTLSAGHP